MRLLTNKKADHVSRFFSRSTAIKPKKNESPANDHQITCVKYDKTTKAPSITIGPDSFVPISGINKKPLSHFARQYITREYGFQLNGNLTEGRLECLMTTLSCKYLARRPACFSDNRLL
jgi:hypothetical protein